MLAVTVPRLRRVPAAEGFRGLFPLLLFPDSFAQCVVIRVDKVRSLVYITMRRSTTEIADPKVEGRVKVEDLEKHFTSRRRLTLAS